MGPGFRKGSGTIHTTPLLSSSLLSLTHLDLRLAWPATGPPESECRDCPKDPVILKILRSSLRWCGKNTTVAKQYGRVSETPCFPGVNSQEISTGSELIYGDRELIRRSIFNTAGSFGCRAGRVRGFRGNSAGAGGSARDSAGGTARATAGESAVVLRGFASRNRPVLLCLGVLVSLMFFLLWISLVFWGVFCLF